jgi:hypothetical protein
MMILLGLMARKDLQGALLLADSSQKANAQRVIHARSSMIVLPRDKIFHKQLSSRTHLLEGLEGLMLISPQEQQYQTSLLAQILPWLKTPKPPTILYR